MWMNHNGTHVTSLYIVPAKTESNLSEDVKTNDCIIINIELIYFPTVCKKCWLKVLSVKDIIVI